MVKQQLVLEVINMTDHEKLLITKYDLLFESRLTKVEATMDHVCKSMDDNFKEIKSDLRWMFGIMLTFSGVLLGLMAHGFKWL